MEPEPEPDLGLELELGPELEKSRPELQKASRGMCTAQRCTANVAGLWPAAIDSSQQYGPAEQPVPMASAGLRKQILLACHSTQLLPRSAGIAAMTVAERSAGHAQSAAWLCEAPRAPNRPREL